MTQQLFWQILAVILGLASAICSGLVLFYLRSLSDRMDRLELRHETLANRKQECQQHFVDKVDFIRNQTRTEKGLDELIKLVSTMQGSLKVIEQMPQICGGIAREVAAEALRAVKEINKHG